MSNTSELKKQAISQLKNRWGLAIGGFFLAIIFFPSILAIINIFASFSSSSPLKIIIYLITLILNIILFIGTVKFSLNYACKEKTPSIDDIFSGFRIFAKALLIYIIIALCIALGFVLVIVPGIIVSLMLSQALYILMDDNSKYAIDCLKESITMMKGHKLECFLLSLSFLGWIALIICPVFILVIFPLPTYFLLIYLLLLFIGLLLLIPYWNITFAVFYLKLKDANYNVSAE